MQLHDLYYTIVAKQGDPSKLSDSGVIVAAIFIISLRLVKLRDLLLSHENMFKKEPSPSTVEQNI